ncbi:MAG: hypothetical protein FJW38_13490 [Acidobacteria bacterium]|nr:hypothetical protein [Acidobacteriota bacterium]
MNRFGGDLFDWRLNRLNSSFAGINYGQARTKSFYNGANFSVRRRYATGFDLQVACMLGKTIDYNSFSGSLFVDSSMPTTWS